MSARITEILKLKNPPKFTANNAVNSVVATPDPMPAADSVYTNAIGRDYFQQKDNIIIKSIQLQMPYMFTLSAGEIYPANDKEKIDLSFLSKDTGVVVSIPEIGASNIWVPQDCPKIELDSFIPWPVNPLAPAEDMALLSSNTMEFDVSQVYAPASLNGVELYINIYLTVEHTLKMVA